MLGGAVHRLVVLTTWLLKLTTERERSRPGKTFLAARGHVKNDEKRCSYRVLTTDKVRREGSSEMVLGVPVGRKDGCQICEKKEEKIPEFCERKVRGWSRWPL